MRDVWLRRILVLLVVVALALLAAQMVLVLLLAFAGVLLAVAVRHIAKIIARQTPLSIGPSLAVVLLGLVAAFVLLTLFAGPRIVEESAKLAQTLPAAWDQVQSALRDTGWGAYLLDHVPSVDEGPRWNILQTLGGTLSTVLGVIANFVVVLTVAVFLAVDPDLYRRGFLHLVPLDRRGRAREVLDTIGTDLWRWLLGQSLDMLAVALMTGFGLWLIGVPLAGTLGIIAGLTNFIPYLGPFIGGIPATLIAFTQSPSAALYTMLLFVVVQQLEGNVLMPMIQKRATALPPALTILIVVGAGVLFGLLGALLATPMLLVILVLVRMLYVEDVLGDQGAQDADA